MCKTAKILKQFWALILASDEDYPIRQWIFNSILFDLKISLALRWLQSIWLYSPLNSDSKEPLFTAPGSTSCCRASLALLWLQSSRLSSEELRVRLLLVPVDPPRSDPRLDISSSSLSSHELPADNKQTHNQSGTSVNCTESYLQRAV